MKKNAKIPERIVKKQNPVQFLTRLFRVQNQIRKAQDDLAKAVEEDSMPDILIHIHGGVHPDEKEFLDAIKALRVAYEKRFGRCKLEFVL